MEPKRIKTALEIALERAERLGAASTEELRRQEEERHLLIGKGLAERYLGGLPLRETEEQLGKYSGANAVAARRGLLEVLADAVGSADSAKAEGSLQAILYFATGEEMRSIAAEIDQVQRRYLDLKENELATRKEKVAFEAALQFASRGIAGSAVRVNLDAQGDWLRDQAGLEAAYEERLTPLRQRLKSAIAGP